MNEHVNVGDISVQKTSLPITDLSIYTVQYHELSHLGSEYKAKQNRCCKLVVLPKFQSKNFMQIQEHPSVHDSEGKKRLHGVSTA